MSSRGTLMGNRGGRFHRDDRTLGSRQYASRQWIACVCDFKRRQRNVWGVGYTELFFLDEVTALAAGHRPCFECRQADAKAFAALFPFRPDEAVKAGDIDRRLHVERLNGKTKRTFSFQTGGLPEGAMFTRNGVAYAIRAQQHLRWSHTGYEPAGVVSGAVDVLTPPAIIAILQRGYRPRWHESVTAFTPQLR